MNFRRQAIARFVAAMFLFLLAASAWSQQPPPKPAVESPEKKPSVEQESPPESFAVAAILATKPATPIECVRAARVLVDLGRLDLAKGFLTKVTDAKLDPQQWTKLGEQVGTSVFLELAGQPALLPEAQQLADAVVAAANAKRADIRRIADLIAQLQDPSARKRSAAAIGLQESQGAAVGPLLQVLADPACATGHASIRAVLAEMGRPARDQLVGILQHADPKLTVQAILVLAAMNDPKVELYLLGPCFSPNSDPAVQAAAAAALRQLTGRMPSRSEAIRFLTDAAKAYFEQHRPVEGAVDGRVELWRWDDKKRRCVAKTFAAEDAARAMAARWAGDAHALAPDNRDVRLLYVAAMLETAAHENGLDRPLDEKDPVVVEAARLGVATIDQALKYGMAHGHWAAATAAARLLGQIGKAEDVLYEGEAPAPLAQAMRQPDRRLRMAALEAIVRLRPSRPFAGSSHVPAALGFFAASSGSRRALAASPNVDETRELAGLLATAGLESDTAQNGRDLLLLAARSPDYELALVDVSIVGPEISMFLQQLRHDERTASLRVGLIARDGYLDQAERLMQQDPLTMAFSRPHDETSVQWQVAQLVTLAPRDFVDFQTRQRQAVEALDLLAALSQSSGKLYDLRRVQDSVIAALYTPPLSAKVVAVLANINSTESQRALVDLASRFTQPIELRQAAAKAFRENTQKHGILLTIDEIQTQYHRYNESKQQDSATQQVLGRILDCLEAAAKQKP